MSKKATEKIKSLFGFRQNRNELLDEALLAVLEAAIASKRLLAEHKKSDFENVDLVNIPLLWSKAAVQIRHREKIMAVQCLYLAETFSVAAGWDELQVEKISRMLDTIFKTVKELLE